MFLFATVLAATAVEFNVPDYWYVPGEVSHLCDESNVSLRDHGPKDSMIFSWCDYEPWMEDWIGSGGGPEYELVFPDG